MAEEQDWAPLPQRNHRRRSRPQPQISAVDENEKVVPVDPEVADWEENVRARARIQWPSIQVEGKEKAHGKYEYLDHTADIQFHAWGDSLKEAFEQMVLCMFDYMTDLKSIHIDATLSREFTASGHDLHSLLFNFMDEILFSFSADGFACRQVLITTFDRDNFIIKADGHGEIFDLSRHPQGTEIKAITYSNMQIHEEEESFSPSALRQREKDVHKNGQVAVKGNGGELTSGKENIVRSGGKYEGNNTGGGSAKRTGSSYSSSGSGNKSDDRHDENDETRSSKIMLLTSLPGDSSSCTKQPGNTTTRRQHPVEIYLIVDI